MPMATKEAQKEYQRTWIAKRRLAYLQDKSCARCGSTEDLRVHHRDRALKISHNIWSWSQERRDKELEKCEILCHSCHVKHHLEDGAFREGVGITPINAKLNPTVVEKIWNLKKEGLSNIKIGRLLSIPRQTIDDVIAGRSWRKESILMAGRPIARHSTVNGGDVGATPTLPAKIETTAKFAVT
jgi:hypothetical protein